MHSSWWITFLVAVPAVAALGVLAVREQPTVARRVALVGAAVEFVLGAVVVLGYNAHVANGSSFDFATRLVLSRPLGLAWDVAIDGLSVYLVGLTALAGLIVVASRRVSEREPQYLAWTLLLVTTLQGAFVAHDAITFFVFFEAVLVPSYFLIVGWGGAARRAAALKFFLYTFVGSAPALVALVTLGVLRQHQSGGDLSFAYGQIAQVVMSRGVANWIFVGLTIGFLVKSPVFPFHTWSPVTYAEAPSGTAALLASVGSKLGSYGLLRFALALTPTVSPVLHQIVIALAVTSILYGAAVACMAKDVRSFAAYSSLSQMGFVTLGVMTGSLTATSGAVLLMLNHGIITLGVFTLVGSLEEQLGTLRFGELRGLQGPAPVFSAVFTVFMLATLGLPGLNGFVAEFLILIGSFQYAATWTLIAAVGVVGSALYWLWAYQRMFHGPEELGSRSLRDATTLERVTLAPLVILVVALGVYPTPVLHHIAPSVDLIVRHVFGAGVGR
jgi:NADH-quinone oxidoreductase subunit M